MKLAAIDIGSNSIHMVVVRAAGAASFEVLDREKEMIFLGRSVFEQGRLSEEALASGLAGIERLHKLAARHGVQEVRAVATAALREAANGGELLRAITERTGVVPQLISGTEEARLIHLAVRSAIDLSARGALTIDIGGGSVELGACDAHGLRLAHSIRLGVQRLRARFGSGPLSKRDRRELEAEIDAQAGPIIASALELGIELVIGTSGTILALAQAAQRQAGNTVPSTMNAQRVTRAALASLRERVVALTPAERSLLDGIDGKRADSLHLGAVLICRLLELAHSSELVLCDRSLREGLVLDFLARTGGSSLAVTDIRRHSVLELARRCGQAGAHAARVSMLALSLFDQTRAIHRLGEADRKLLEYAALLHDIGQHIGYERHEQHAAYIITNGDLRGFTELDRSVLALVVRYHRKARPRRRDRELASVSPSRRHAVRTLSAMLRLADGLDRSQHQLVRAVHCAHDDRDLVVRIEADGDPELELWGARRNARPLERALGRRISIDLESLSRVPLALRYSA